MGLILLVRHGQASFGAADYDRLSSAGAEQAERLGAALSAADVRPTAVIRGGLRRHRETMDSILRGAGWAGTQPDGQARLEVIVDPDWDEFDHLAVMSVAGLLDQRDSGDLHLREFHHRFDLATQRWFASESASEYAETWVDFTKRSLAALVRACAAAGSGELVMVVSSAGPIAAACASLIDPDAPASSLVRPWRAFNTVMVNTAISRVLMGAGGARLLTFNEHQHLDAGLVTYR